MERTSIGSAFLHLILRASGDSVRATAIKSLPALAAAQPAVVHATVRDGVHAWLSTQDAANDPLKIVNPEEEPVGLRTQKIGQLLQDLFSPAQSQAIDKTEMQAFAVDMLIIAHHPLLTEGAHTSWINLVQSAGLDPADLAVERRERILAGLWKDAEGPTRVGVRVLLRANPLTMFSARDSLRQRIELSRPWLSSSLLCMSLPLWIRSAPI
jgi:hypothetical protein